MLPIMIRHLGAERYGFWMLVADFTVYYGYLDLGIRSAVSYYVALYIARHSATDLNETAATAFWSITALSGLMALTGLGLARLFPLLFDISRIDSGEVRLTVILMTLYAAIGLPAEVLGAILNGNRRLDIPNIADAVTRAASAVGTFVCLVTGAGLVAISLVQVCAKLVYLLWNWVALRRVLPEISLAITLWRLGCLRRLAGFGVPSLLLSLGVLVSSRTDLVVIGMFLGVRMVALYSIPRSLMEYAATAVRTFAASFTAHLTHLHAQHRADDLYTLYRRASRLSGLAAFLLSAYIAAFGRSFLALWQGPAFVTGPWTGRADLALLILAAAFLPRLLSSMNTQLLYATKRLSFIVWINAIEAAIKICLSLLLVRPWGLAGVAVSNLIPMLLFEGVAIPAYVFRGFPIWSRSFVVDVFGRPIAAGAVAYLASMLLVAWHEPASWPIFLGEAALAGVIGLGTAIVVGLEKGELKL